MAEKTALVFAEIKKTFGVSWIAVYYDGRIFVQCPEDAARDLRKLRKQDYKIIDSGIQLEKVVRFNPYGYRNINRADRRILAKYDAELEHWEKYPGMFPKELNILNKLKDSDIKTGLLWVDDVSLYPKEELEDLRKNMGEPYAPRTTYCLAIKRRPELIGRIDISQYLDVIRYFSKVLVLKNSDEKQAKRFSRIGRPMKKSELEYLISNGINVVK